ncbi:DNA polymerase III subunit gamma/tau, partial [Vibrio campbellii]
DLPFSPNERTGLEMTLLRMLAFRPAQQSVVNAISTQVVAQPQANVQPAPAQPMQAAAPSEAQPPMMGEPPMMAPEPYYDPMPEQYMDQGAPAVPPQSS